MVEFSRTYGGGVGMGGGGEWGGAKTWGRDNEGEMGSELILFCWQRGEVVNRVGVGVVA